MTTKSSKKASKKNNGSEEPEELELKPSPAFQAKLNGNAPEVEIFEVAPAPPLAIEPPAPTYEVLFDQPVTLFPLLEDCWNEVRDGDATFAESAPDFKGTLLAHALGVLRTSEVLLDDSRIAKFERAVQVRQNKGQIEVLSYINRVAGGR